MIKSIEWIGGRLRIVDQTEIPNKLVYRELQDVEEVYEAIKKLRVRGAPAIGVVAVFGLYLGLCKEVFPERSSLISRAKYLAEYLSKARPTAVNLNWALQNALKRLESVNGDVKTALNALLDHALKVKKDDEIRCAKIGEYGASLIMDGMNILTHCNTGVLATAGIGTALGAIYTAWKHGKKIKVLVDETRPLLQGARLTIWELQQAGIPCTLITDNMSAYAMKLKKVDMVIVGADRITVNGDVANKIGTYSLAIQCKYHGIPFYVAAPLSTFDFSLSSGDQIPIEERNGNEITQILGKVPIASSQTLTWNPAFDVTPNELITGFITEKGIAKPPFKKSFHMLKFF